METPTRTRVNATDMMTGLLAVLSARGYTSLHYRETPLQRGFYAAASHLKDMAPGLGLNVRFPATAESTRELPHALHVIAACGLISYQGGDLCFSKAGFTKASFSKASLSLIDLATLPGSPDLYRDLA